ncbi:SinR-like protein [Enterococcus faecalis]|nr:hypothetical protein [Enterococcus faecalis]MBC2813711.1 SinR-like protein [Enterococcus faecalis]MBC2816831.1 SinR-like protein [Enterococcus faecalis]MBC2833569.1 SinR-like protein [Enterococcus faecalis]MBC2849528.1 SinR-like protein [Enterococcus faecalis]MDT2167990.1 hypothetical protein [Enterococcus faecalis]
MMKSYALTYDLQSPGQKYAKIADTIASWNCSHIKPLESFWLIKTDMTAAQMKDTLKQQALDDNDLIFITEIGPDHAGWLYTKSWEFIENEIY